MIKKALVDIVVHIIGVEYFQQYFPYCSVHF